MNRVYCLYRVSTSQQLHEDDIPMQRQACREFANTHGWTIIKEFYEKGISGFKTPTSDRRVLQQIKKDAELRKFDILLVFMFDRLGRRDSETPFFVEDLSMSGIQIWSVKEGQQRFESHVDKLINYIRYWQASGESLKTSERIKTRMAQLTTDGIFCGGSCPYGYQLIMSVCGHCGGRIFASTARKSHHPTIEENIRISIYKCYNRVQHHERCTGQTTYRAAKIEQVVLNQLEEYVEANRELQKLNRQFLQAELPIRKMILSQWIDRVVVHSYEHIEVHFSELEETADIVQRVFSRF